jgi:hypothetical protein
MKEITQFAKRGAAYLESAQRSKDDRSRKQYLELAASCLEAAARRAHALLGNGSAPKTRNGPRGKHLRNGVPKLH